MDGPSGETPAWAWVLITILLAGGALVSLVVLFLGAYTASAPDCSAVTSAGKAAHRIAGGVIVLSLAATWATTALGVTRMSGTLRRLVIAALPLVVAPLLLLGTSAALDARMQAIGDDGGSSCF